MCPLLSADRPSNTDTSRALWLAPRWREAFCGWLFNFLRRKPSLLSTKHTKSVPYSTGVYSTGNTFSRCGGLCGAKLSSASAAMQLITLGQRTCPSRTICWNSSMWRRLTKSFWIKATTIFFITDGYGCSRRKTWSASSKQKLSCSLCGMIGCISNTTDWMGRLDPSYLRVRTQIILRWLAVADSRI